jgi:hypothetical protein
MNNTTVQPTLSEATPGLNGLPSELLDMIVDLIPGEGLGYMLMANRSLYQRLQSLREKYGQQAIQLFLQSELSMGMIRTYWQYSPLDPALRLDFKDFFCIFLYNIQCMQTNIQRFRANPTVGICLANLDPIFLAKLPDKMPPSLPWISAALIGNRPLFLDVLQKMTDTMKPSMGQYALARMNGLSEYGSAEQCPDLQNFVLQCAKEGLLPNRVRTSPTISGTLLTLQMRVLRTSIFLQSAVFSQAWMELEYDGGVFPHRWKASRAMLVLLSQIELDEKKRLVWKGMLNCHPLPAKNKSELSEYIAANPRDLQYLLLRVLESRLLNKNCYPFKFIKEGTRLSITPDKTISDRIMAKMGSNVACSVIKLCWMDYLSRLVQMVRWGHAAQEEIDFRDAKGADAIRLFFAISQGDTNQVQYLTTKGQDSLRLEALEWMLSIWCLWRLDEKATAYLDAGLLCVFKNCPRIGQEFLLLRHFFTLLSLKLSATLDYLVVNVLQLDLSTYIKSRLGHASPQPVSDSIRVCIDVLLQGKKFWASDYLMAQLVSLKLDRLYEELQILYDPMELEPKELKWLFRNGLGDLDRLLEASAGETLGHKLTQFTVLNQWVVAQSQPLSQEDKKRLCAYLLKEDIIGRGSWYIHGLIEILFQLPQYPRLLSAIGHSQAQAILESLLNQLQFQEFTEGPEGEQIETLRPETITLWKAIPKDTKLMIPIGTFKASCSIWSWLNFTKDYGGSFLLLEELCRQCLEFGLDSPVVQFLEKFIQDELDAHQAQADFFGNPGSPFLVDQFCAMKATIAAHRAGTQDNNTSQLALRLK